MSEQMNFQFLTAGVQPEVMIYLLQLISAAVSVQEVEGLLG